MTTQRIFVTEKELAILKNILKTNLTDEVVFVFGSRARGTHRATSDIDLALLGMNPLPLSKRAKLELAFSESDLPFRVDVVDLATADKTFHEAIQRDAIRLDY